MANAQFNFDFGAAPLPARKSSRKTPSDLPARLSSRKTPQQLAPRLSTRKTPTEGGAKESGSSSSNRKSVSIARSAVSGAEDDLPQTYKTPSVTGKRKRGEQSLAAVQETESDELEPNESDIVDSLGQSVHKSIEISPTKMTRVPIQGEHEEEDELSPEQPSRGEAPTLNATHNFQTPSLPLVEKRKEATVRRGNSQSIPSELARGRSRTRKSVTATSAIFEEDIALSDDELSPNNQATTGAESNSRTYSSTTAPREEMSTLFVPANQSTQRQVYETQDDRDELSPPQANSRAPPPPSELIDIVIEEDPEARASDEDELSPQPRLQPTKKSGRPTIPIQIREDTIHREESSDELTPQPSRQQPKTQPSRPPLAKTTANIQKRKPQSKSTDRARSPAAKKQKTIRSSGMTVPITVYRRSKPQDTDDDPLGADPTPGLNPADVLAQVTGELVSNYISTWTELPQQQQSQASKKTQRRQINALITFRNSLQDSLFDLTIAQNTSYILAMRVRKANKEKRQLREELIARRREREEVELRIDRLRADRQAKLVKETREHDLVQGLFDIEAAIKKGREFAIREGRQDEGPELGIEMLAADVFESVGTGGILGRVGDWNNVLEETAGLIEGRA